MTQPLQKAVTPALNFIRGFGKKYISPKKLAHIQQIYKPEDFKPRWLINKVTNRRRWLGPRIPLRQQGDMRKNCLYLGIDPASIGMPDKPPRKPPRDTPREGHKWERELPARIAKIEKALAEMPQTVAKWRAEKRAEKERNKPNLPY
ncbi:hypothetical protein G9A89_002026 [Geosiphon pyriformis]|nr:hypothetical protein G9A89_006328 [Geosiphon pyriformis]KAG9306029.1 hypothetical protein G9A89_002026 [Geosiphon pyriformis]